MKFGKNISSQRDDDTDLYYIEYTALKKHIKDVVAQLQSNSLGDALSANITFEVALNNEIQRVNDCFAKQQVGTLAKTAELSEEMQSRTASTSASRHAGESQSQDVVPTDVGDKLVWQGQMSSFFQRLVSICGDVDHLRKYAVWNSVAVVKILKKRRKQTSFGLDDVTAERSGWLTRLRFFTGEDFAELHAATESLGHALIFAEFGPFRKKVPADVAEDSGEQCPICMEKIVDVVELSCKHRFCWKCFVLGPIAFQPGEYRMTQCPVCRQEDDRGKVSTALCDGETSEADQRLTETGMPSSEGVISRFLHTYFNQEADSDVESERGSRLRGNSEFELRDVVGELMKALHPLAKDAARAHTTPEIAQGSAASSAPSDFFQTLPQTQVAQDTQDACAAQKLQWLQRASYNYPLAVDTNMMNCSLCSEPLLMEAITTTPCKHCFHRVCLGRLDMPECPLCNTRLPLSWFIPSDHPLADCGFRVVQPRAYKPIFPGGPSLGSCGYPLHSPPPVSLLGPGGLTMRSYLHCLVPMGGASEEVDDATDQDEGGTPPVSSRASKVGSGERSSASDETSSEESGSEFADVSDGQPCGSSAWTYSALGKISLCKPPPESARVVGAAVASPCFGLPLSTLVGSADSCARGDTQRCPTVLCIDQHL
eukprot:TRINITY_DN7524_c0_g1_i2.p1 TRINITY_DN7524_c0_g1~~TRINITY_DN7524_c0_g1_i2.p1  ORF type:complete len:654 (-),score=105.40 TRINITY_DN7524_c0_g1_i2:179-2140(-)